MATKTTRREHLGDRRSGTCRWCGCSEFNPCPEGCGWANTTQTLCTACVDVDREWMALDEQPTAFRRAFFRGFMAGSDDERATDTTKKSPYGQGQSSKFWWFGVGAGFRHSR